MKGPIQTNRYQQNALKARFRIRGIYVARLLVVVLLALDITLGLTILYSRHGLPGYHLQHRQVRKMENALIKIRTENQKLFELIQTIRTDPKAQERLVRRQLGWVGKHEIILESPDRIEGGGNWPIKPFDSPK